MSVLPVPATVSALTTQSEELTSGQDHDGVLLLGPLKELDLILSRCSDDLSALARLDEVRDRLIIGVVESSSRRPGDFALVLAHPLFQGSRVLALLLTDFPRLLGIDDKPIDIIFVVGVDVLGPGAFFLGWCWLFTCRIGKFLGLGMTCMMLFEEI